MIFLPVSGLDATLDARIYGAEVQEVLGLPEREWALVLRPEPELRWYLPDWSLALDGADLGALERALVGAEEELLAMRLSPSSAVRMVRVESPFPSLRVRVRQVRDGTSWCELRVRNPPPATRCEQVTLDVPDLAAWLEVIAAVPGRVEAMFAELDRDPRAGARGEVRHWLHYVRAKPARRRAARVWSPIEPPRRRARAKPQAEALEPFRVDDAALVEAVLAAGPRRIAPTSPASAGPPPTPPKTRADLAGELGRATEDWTRPQLVRQFDASRAGLVEIGDTAAVMREHGYEPGSPVYDRKGPTNVTYVRRAHEPPVPS